MKLKNPSSLKKHEKVKDFFKQSKSAVHREISNRNNKSKSTSKSKSKNKSKSKQFNPLEYLNALIELTSNSQSLKGKSNKGGKRDLSSALTIATPNMQKTISTSKIRCKSSYSQYRKRSTTPGFRQVLKVNLDQVLTQQDNIKYSSISQDIQESKNDTKQHQAYPFVHLSNIDYNYYAIKIQRAWRSYQTYKMVRKYYKHYKKQHKYYQQRNDNKLYEVDQKYKVNKAKPNVQAYLNDYYDIPLSHQYQQNIIQHEELFQKTLKIKIKKSETSLNGQDPELSSHVQIQHALQSSFQNSDDLNLTQKLNQIKLYVEQGKDQEQQAYKQTQQIPTIQMKKSHKNSYDKTVRDFSKDDDHQEKTQKKKAYLSKPFQRKTVSISDVIAQQTESRYNQILQLIINNVSNDPNSKSQNDILKMLLEKFEENKNILESDFIGESILQNKCENNSQVCQEFEPTTPKQQMVGYNQEAKKNQAQNSEKSYNSQNMLCFDSKEIYSFDSSESKKSGQQMTENKAIQASRRSDQNDSLLLLDESSLKKIYDFQERLKSEEKKLMNLQYFTGRDEYWKQNKLNFQQKNEESEDNLLLNSDLKHKKIIPVFQSHQNSDEKIFYDQIQRVNIEDSDSDGSSIYSLKQYKKQANLFKQHEKLLELRKQSSIQNLQKLFSQSKFPASQYSAKFQQIECRYRKQQKSIENKKHKYFSALQGIKRQALNFQKALISSNSGKKELGKNLSEQKLMIRKSFSTESIVLKCILAESRFNYSFDKVQIKDIESDNNLLGSENIENDSLYYSDKKSGVKMQDESSVDIETSQYDIDSSISKSQFLDIDQIKKCAEQIEQIIEKQLINQLLEEMYLNQNILKPFRPFIEEIFEFTRINDEDINSFIQDIKQYFPSRNQLLLRANQKINPSSLQILRLIRDYDFEIEEYELLLSENILKQTRKRIEIEYDEKVKQRKSKLMKPNTDIKNLQVIDKMFVRQGQKSSKIEKYLNYQRDLKNLYFKAVFNCMNELLIEQKSQNTRVHSRSTIGTGELTFAIKQLNGKCTSNTLERFLSFSETKLYEIIQNKCMIPSFKSYKQVQIFQKQMLKIIKIEIDQTEYKWVNFMDEVLEIWYQITCEIIENIFEQTALEIQIITNHRIKINQ